MMEVRCCSLALRCNTFVCVLRADRVDLQGCKEAGIPCFGTLWDFVRTLRLAVAVVGAQY